jgi:hypothetical protein
MILADSSTVDLQPAMIRVICPHCELLLGLGSETAGQVAVCPNCGQRLRVPSVTPSVSESAEPPAYGPQPGPPPPAASASPTDYAERPRRPRRRRRFGSRVGESAALRKTGQLLVIVILSLVGFLECLDLILEFGHHPKVEEAFTKEALAEFSPEQLRELRNEFTKVDAKRVVMKLGRLVFLGAFGICLATGLNWARITIAVVLFVSSACTACAGGFVFFLGPFAGMQLGAFWPELIVIGLVLGLYPTAGITLLASSSVQAFCRR